LEVAHIRLQDEKRQLSAKVDDLTRQLNEMEEKVAGRQNEPNPHVDMKSSTNIAVSNAVPGSSLSTNIALSNAVPGSSLDPRDDLDQQLGLDAACQSTNTSELTRGVMYNETHWRPLNGDLAVDTMPAMPVMEGLCTKKVARIEAEIARRGPSFLSNSQRDTSHFYVGAWKDRTNRFYSGKTILIGETEWMPIAMAHRTDLNYEVRPSLDNGATTKSNQLEICLCEILSDGTTKVFAAQRGAGSTMIVTCEDAPELRCVLDHHKDEGPTPSKRLTSYTIDVTQILQSQTTGPLDSKDLWERWISKLDKLLKTNMFDYCMGSIIVLNSVCLGISSELSLPGGPGVPVILEHFENLFLTLYVIESAANLLARGKACFKDQWFLFDFSLVVIGAAYQWCIQYLIPEENGSVLEQVLVLRTLRLLRLLRAMRMLPMLKVVWRLTYGLLTSANTMLSTLALIILILYMFACLGLELITKRKEIRDNAELMVLVDLNFKNLYTTMVTLLQFVTLDSVAAIYGPFVQAEPWLLLYFFPIILVVSVALMNMVTAVLVEGALAQANSDRDARNRFLIKKVKQHTPMFKAIFAELDNDDSQSITVGELENLNIEDLPPLCQQAMENFKFENMVELFEMLDGDTSGSINEEEFVNGLVNLSLTDHQVPPEVIIILKLARTLTRRSNDLTSQLAEVRGDIHQLFLEMSKGFTAPHHRQECKSNTLEVLSI